MALANRITRYQTHQFSPGIFELEMVAEAEQPEPGPSPPAAN